MEIILKFVITAKYFVIGCFLSSAEKGLEMKKNGNNLIFSLLMTIRYILIKILGAKGTHSVQFNVRKITVFIASKIILEGKYLTRKGGVLLVLKLVTVQHV